MPATQVSQTSTFTHFYAVAGTYVARFTVSCNSKGDNIYCPDRTAQTSITVVVGNNTIPTLLVGCTSTSGFSSATGARCNGCTSDYGYSPTNGESCNTTTVALPVGCISTSGYSLTTGVNCNGCISTSGYSPTTGVSCSITVTPTCTDSDGGKDYYTKGKIEATNWGTAYDSCLGNNSMNLMENYCDNGVAKMRPMSVLMVVRMGLRQHHHYYHNDHSVLHRH